MTETAYERGYRVGASQGGGGAPGGPGDGPPAVGATAPGSSPSSGGILSQKWGPLPVWAWMTLGLAVILGFSYWKNRKNATSSTGTGSQGGSTPSSLVPQFVNQVYTNPVPPSDTDITVNAGTGPPGPPGRPGPPGKRGPGGPPGKTWVPPQRYTVRPGDTLLTLSQKYLGTTNRTELAHDNGLGTGAGLRTGQQLTIPGHWSM